jgi:D-glycero-D-manno-heptose 1,7-bisphosphate phosphatase
LNALARCNFDAARTWMIGDSAADIGAARAANVRAALVFPLNHCEICPLRDGPALHADLMASRFDELARAILRA